MVSYKRLDEKNAPQRDLLSQGLDLQHISPWRAVLLYCFAPGCAFVRVCVRIHAYYVVYVADVPDPGALQTSTDVSRITFHRRGPRG